MPVPWRVAKSLLKLRDQWQAAHPGAANPGFIGDADHASRESDHNPWVDDPASSLNVVTAGDFYHQPALGADAYALADRLKAAKDPRVKYVISRRRIWSLARDSEGWRPYNGSNPHTGHTHVSVSSTKSRYDDTRPWNIGATQPDEEDEMTPAQMAELKRYVDQRQQAYSFWLDMRSARREFLMAQAAKSPNVAKAEELYVEARKAWEADQKAGTT
jgi:hypothetical protein